MMESINEIVYTREDFYDACKKLLGEAVFNTVTKATMLGDIDFLCKQVAKHLLLDTLECNDKESLCIVQVTAYNLWIKDGTHHLKLRRKK